MRRAVVAAVACVVLTGACSGSGPLDGGTGAGPGGPTVTNSAGESVTLDEAPRRVVTDAQTAAALWGYGVRPAALIGVLVDDPATLGDVDPTGIPTVGGGFEVDLEGLAALQPDLIIASEYLCGVTFGRNAEDPARVAPFAPEINRIAPCVGVSTGPGVLAQLALYADLAAALGGDPADPRIAADRESFEAVGDRIRELARQRPEIDVVAFSGSGTNVYALRALPQGRAPVRAEDPGFRYLADELGVRVTGPDSSTESFVPISPEQFTAYPADVVFVNTNARTGAGPAQFATWNQVPAVAAGQVATFDDYRPTTYAAWSAWMSDQVVPALRDAADLG